MNARQRILFRFVTSDRRRPGARGYCAALDIDPDTYRAELPGYTGSNSSLFQRVVSVLVSAVHDEALRLQQSFLLDGTASNYDTVSLNIRRSLKRGRFVLVLYVYQNPE